MELSISSIIFLISHKLCDNCYLQLILTAVFPLKQKEIISLGLLAQQQSYTAAEMSKILNQSEEHGLRNWLGKLLDYDLVIKSGRGKGTQYAINPKFIKKLDFKGKTTLKNIEDYKLEELIYKDISAYPNSAFGDIHKRIGDEINQHKVRRILKKMVQQKILGVNGVNRWVKYSIEQNMRENE